MWSFPVVTLHAFQHNQLIRSKCQLENGEIQILLWEFVPQWGEASSDRKGMANFLVELLCTTQPADSICEDTVGLPETRYFYLYGLN